MPFDPPFDDNWWPNPGPPRSDPADASPGYWTDPFINPPASATDQFANVPPPWSAARLGAMAWQPPIFLGDPLTFVPSNFQPGGWPPPLPPAAPQSVASAMFPHDPSIPAGGLFPYSLGPTTDAGPSALSGGFLGEFGRRAATLTPAFLAGLPPSPAARRMIDSAMFPRDPSLPSGGILGEIGRMAMRLMPDASDAWPAPGWPAAQSPYAPWPQSQNPFAAGGSAPDLSNDPLPSPSDSSSTPAPPQRSVLFNGPQPAWDLGAHLLERDREAAILDSTAQGLGPVELPLTKSGAPYVSPAPQPSIIPQLSIEQLQWLDVARLLSPNLVDYFTKTLPPAPPFPTTPGKVPSLDNPYAVGAAIEATALLPLGLERGFVGPLVRAASAAERSAAETASGRIAAALRAAVDSGNLTQEQAAVLRQRAIAASEGGTAGLNAPASPWLPKFDGETTYGVLITNEGNVVPLRSGQPGTFWNYPSAKHVEGKAAIWIRENDSSGGVVYHNNTDGTCGFCNTQIKRLLPNDTRLDVVSPSDAVAKNSMAKAGLAEYTGDETMPKLPPLIQQYEMFGKQR